MTKPSAAAAYWSLRPAFASATQVADAAAAISSIAKMTNQMKMMIVGHEFRPWLRKRGHTIGRSVPRIATKQFQPKDRRSHLALMGEQTHGDLDQRQRARTLEPAQLTLLHEEVV